MMKKLFPRFCLILAVTLSAYSCRTDQFHENETYNNSSKFQLTSKRISLDEAKHKKQLIPELEKSENGMNAPARSVQSKTVDFGNSVSIDTDEVIFIDKGSYHTYTFHIKKENEPADAPVENLVLSSLPDGTYKEFLFSYNFTAEEKQGLTIGIPVDAKGRVTVTELVQGTYNNGGLMGRTTMVCDWVEKTMWNPCSSGRHDGSNADECEFISNFTNGTPPTAYVVVTRECRAIALPADTSLGENGQGGGSGPQNGPGGLGGEEPEETVTAPNLPVKQITPCQKITKIGKADKTKTLFQNLKTKTNSTKEFGEILVDNGLEITNTSVEGETGQGGINLDLSIAIDGFIHSHYAGLLSVFSPGDLATISGLYQNGLIKNPNTFVFGLVTASNTQYIMVIDDPVKFTTFAQQFLTADGQIDINYTDNYGEFKYLQYNIMQSGLASNNELGFVKMLLEQNSGIKVLKGSNNSNDWAELTIKNGIIDPKPCN